VNSDNARNALSCLKSVGRGAGVLAVSCGFIVVALLSLPLAAASPEFAVPSKDALKIERLRSYGATVSVAYLPKSAGVEYQVWVRGRNGIERSLVVAADLRPVVSIGLSHANVANEGMHLLDGFGQLRHLSLRGQNYNDLAAEAVASLYWLDSLDISETSISNEGFKCFGRLRRLSSVRASGTRLGQGGLQCLPDLSRSLRRLYLRDTAIRNGDCKEIAAAEHLRVLDISCTAIDDVGLEQVCTLARLTHLYLHQTKVSDRAADLLGDLQQLREIGISGTRVTKEGLAAIVANSSVRDVYLDPAWARQVLHNRHGQLVALHPMTVDCKRSRGGQGSSLSGVAQPD
jgi:hypothetical protein